MSYDLRFVPRAGSTPPLAGSIGTYLKQQPNVTVKKRQAVYDNPHTQVYFLFDLLDDPREPLVAAINVWRPSVFALEAAEFISLVAEHFSLDVVDDQLDTKGAFDANAFVAGWTQTNDASLRGAPSGERSRPTLPRDDLVTHWRWNRHVGRTGQVLGEMFAARVRYRVSDGVARSFASVVENNPTAVPIVDDVMLMRQVPKKFGSRNTFEESVSPFALVRPFAVRGAETVDGLPYVSLVDMRELYELQFKGGLRPDQFGYIALESLLDREAVGTRS